MSYQPTESPNTTWRARRKSWRRLSVEKRRHVSSIPARYCNLGLADLPDTPAGRTVKRWCKRWSAYPADGLPLDDFENNRGRGLWLYGAPGTGKTRSAAIALNHLSDLGWCSKFVTVSDLYDLSLRPMRVKDEDEREVWQSFYDAYDAGWDGWRILALDDLGKEHKTASGWIENQLDSILRNRFNTGAPTIITTNLTLDEIAEEYNASMRDFLGEAFTAVAMTGRSHRAR